ncbi:glycosyltransferase family 39 protein [Candidatus Microgenomates bacterium]|nr:glycosyltransferase family 39 protein [Candidatus Microgenomates bacterium]
MFLFLITIIAAFLRFYNLMWGDGFFFHPDERNMAISITKLCFDFSSILPSTLSLEPRTGSCSMNPQFFAYGQFPTYLVYFSYQIIKLLRCYVATLLSGNLNQVSCSISPVPFPSAVLGLRFWSALASTLTIPLVYLITKELIKKRRKKEISNEESAESPQNFCSETRRGIIFSLFATSPDVRRDGPRTRKNSSRPQRLNNQQKFSWVTSALFDQIPLLAALLAALTPGLIQTAHFGTTESLLTFFFMLIIYLSLKFLKTEKIKWLLLSGVISGIALGTKLSAAFFLIAPLITLILVCKKRPSLFRKISKCLLFCFLFFVFCSLFFAVSSPYNLLEFNDFLGTNTYETHVAQGKSPVFYTDQFAKTTPIIYQLTRIFPYALGPILSILGVLGFLIIAIDLIKNIIKKIINNIINNIGLIVGYMPRSRHVIDISKTVLIILMGSFLAYFLPNVLLFCKWTRFITPIMPFFAIFGSYFLSMTINWLRQKKLTMLLRCYVATLLIFSIIPGLLFFTIYLKPDIRIEASEWIHQNIPDNTYILSETANVVDIPIHPRTYKVISFNFYDLDINPSLLDQLTSHLEAANYIFVPSHRIFDSRLRLSEKYPLNAQYYRLLFSGDLGFEKVVHFSRLPDEKAEETWSVFDHPAIRIYKKTKPFSKQEYQRLLKDY